MVTSEYECGCGEAACDVCEPSVGQSCSTGGCGCGSACDAPAPELCQECGGLVKPGVAEYAAHEGGRVLLITGIPAEVCIRCGAGYFTGTQVDQMWSQWQSFLTGDTRLAAVAEYIGDADEKANAA